MESDISYWPHLASAIGFLIALLGFAIWQMREAGRRGGSPQAINPRLELRAVVRHPRRTDTVGHLRELSNAFDGRSLEPYLRNLLPPAAPRNPRLEQLGSWIQALRLRYPELKIGCHAPDWARPRDAVEA